MANVNAKKAASVGTTAAETVPAALISLADGAPVSDAGDTFVSLEEALASSGNDPLAVLVQPADDVRALAPVLGRLTQVAISFPTFRDGRGYSSARLLRDELGYTGQLRAVGDVLLDQVVFLKRCGFDVAALRKASDAPLVAKALSRFADVYQPASDTDVPVWKRRR
jgi:uncharacterized protein (DUF934 family)